MTSPHYLYTDYIIVWKFHEAPEEYRKWSTSGGDEDWLAIIPEHMKEEYIPWMESGGPFGCCSVDSFDLPDGRQIRIGSHA